MGARERWAEFTRLCREARRLSLDSAEMREVREKIARAYEEFLSSLPEDRRRDSLVILSSELQSPVIPREEVPRLIREDDGFFTLILRVYGR